MARDLTRFALAMAALFLAACSTVTVTTDYDHSASFTQYHSYDLALAPQQPTLSPSSENALRASLRNGLATHGLSEVDQGADLHVVAHVSSKEKIDVHQSPAWGYGGLPYRYGYYGMWAGAPPYYTDIHQYTEGTLILDFVDAKTQKLVFRGVAKGTLSDPETNAEHVREAVAKIVQGMPGAAPPSGPHHNYY